MLEDAAWAIDPTGTGVCPWPLGLEEGRDPGEVVAWPGDLLSASLFLPRTLQAPEAPWVLGWSVPSYLEQVGGQSPAGMVR